MWYNIKVVGTKATWWHDADIAQLVEHVIGNDEVISSNLIISSKNPEVRLGVFDILRDFDFYDKKEGFLTKPSFSYFLIGTNSTSTP